MKLVRSLAVALAIVAGLAGVARGELVQDEDLILSFDGGILPRALPRDTPTPVAIWVDSSLRVPPGKLLPPQLEKISIAINRKGKIFDRGLPTCRVREIQPSTMKAAKRICGGAIVGRGHVGVLVEIENGRPFFLRAPLLAFNADPLNGNRRMFVQAYAKNPPGTFVLPFTIRRRPGTFGTVVSASLPESAKSWAYITEFQLRLQRHYTYKGEAYSFINASCAAPEGFPVAVYPFAEASYEF